MDFERWQLANDAYLAARLAWLRSRLGASQAGELGASSGRAFDGLTRFEGTSGEINDPDAASSLAPEVPPSDTGMLPALEVLMRRLGLSAFECDVLFLCAALELDPRVPALCARAQGDLARAYPTFALALSLFDNPAWDVLSPERPLRRYRLIEINQPGATPLTAAALRADERIVNYLKGLNELDDRLTPLLVPVEESGNVALAPTQQAIADEVIAQLERASEVPSMSGHLPLIQLAGIDSASKQLVAQLVARAFGLELVRLPIDVIPTDLTELETLLRLWERESRLLPLGLYVDASETEARGTDRPWSPQLRFLSRTAGVVFLDTPELRHSVGRPTVGFDVAKPTPAEQRDLWSSALRRSARSTTADVESIATSLASQFSLNPIALHRIASTRPATASAVADLTTELWSACRRTCRPRLDSLAQRLDARATWDDLVLPDDETRQLREIASQVRFRGVVYDDWGFRKKHNRGLGVSVLFAGESGTGKTMAAEVIANDLQLDLYRIDLSAVVNKYIGETEKNLRKLFDAADDGGVILFFDEADSLFGKRTEVKDSHDRYANLEVNYLLQRMEAYRGLAILATNMKTALDQAFLRRLRFVVNFPIPDAAQRREIWRKAFPADMPVGMLDYERLSRLNVTGGNIHTIALNAAFASAGAYKTVHSHRELGMSQVFEAARTEYRKLQKPINAGEFRGVEMEGVRR